MGFSPGFGDLPPDFGGDNGGDFNSGDTAALQVYLNQLFSFVVNVANFLWGIIKALASALASILKHLHDFLLKAWQDYIKKALDWLVKHFRTWIDWLRKHVKSAIAFLKKIKKWYDQHILPFQLKQLALIQHIRQILGILKAFHVKWAQTLDNKLADIQNRIVASIEITRGALNSIINFVGLIFDPSLLIRRTALGGSLLNMLGGLKRIAGFGSGLGMTKAQASQMQRDQQMYTQANVKAYIQTVNATGPTPEDQQWDLEARDALSEVTGVAQ